jgi:hypothetical protein
VAELQPLLVILLEPETLMELRTPPDTTMESEKMHVYARSVARVAPARSVKSPVVAASWAGTAWPMARDVPVAREVTAPLKGTTLRAGSCTDRPVISVK